MNQTEFYERVLRVVDVTQKPVLIVNLFGIWGAFIVESFSSKSRDFNLNEVVGAQDITKLLLNWDINWDKDLFETRLSSINKQDFSFGHDDFIFLKRYKKNEY